MRKEINSRMNLISVSYSFFTESGRFFFRKQHPRSINALILGLETKIIFFFKNFLKMK